MRSPKHRRQLHGGCRGVGRTPGNIWSAADEMSYIPKVSHQIACRTELMRRPTVQPAFAVEAKKHRVSETVGERMTIFILHVIHYALLGCAYTSGLMRDECQ